MNQNVIIIFSERCLLHDKTLNASLYITRKKKRKHTGFYQTSTKRTKTTSKYVCHSKKKKKKKNECEQKIP